MTTPTKLPQLVIASFALAFTAFASAGEPHALKNCGFSAPAAVSNGIWRFILGQGLDCILWGCIPIIGPTAAAAAVWEEVDVDCAGVVFEVKRRDGSYSYMTWRNGDSLSGIRAYGKRKCVAKKRGACREVLAFRHAVAGYRLKGANGRVYWAQGGDIPTAKQIAKARCDAAGRSCTFYSASENRN